MISEDRLKKLFQRLVDIYSPSGKENDILDYLRGYLKRNSIAAKVQAVDETRYNLVVLPENSQAELALIGHVDTVTAYDIEDYGWQENQDTISGLGTADMKSGCAAMVEAFLALRRDYGPRLPAALCLVVGEEENGDGAARLIEDYHFPWAVIGEPTNLVACLGCYGYLETQMASIGKRLHASLANNRENTIEVLLQMMMRVSQYMRDHRPELVYNFRDLYSSRSGLTVPDRCEAWLDVHLPPDAAIGEIVTELEEVCMPAETGHSGIETRFHIETIDAGYRLPEKGPVVEAVRDVYTRRQMTWQSGDFRSHSDANQLWAAGIKPMVLGPGRLENAHVHDECVSFPQVVQAAEIYLGLMQQLFCGP
ncbi:MAG: M20/M25/M40 family metallo-hydrolase [Desulfobacterales bacterium]|nr:M20/M25/M40 family metallo-hydrolase [Desulfobacterales bacterium]